MNRCANDNLCVCTACLADILRPIVEAHRARFSDTNVHAHNSYLVVRDRTSWSDGGATAVGVLAREGNTSERRVSGILRVESATTGLRIADNLLVGIDRPDLLRHLKVYHRSRGGFGYTPLATLWKPGEHICTIGFLKEADFQSVARPCPVEPSGEAPGRGRGQATTLTERAA